jgi:hypothetical protein
MPEAQTNNGSKLSICVLTQNEDLTETAFSALTYVQLKKVGNVGERGITTSIFTYETWDTAVALKGKGISNAGDPEVEMARDLADPDQTAMRAAGQPDVQDAYACKVERPSGEIEYLRGLVTGPRTPSGRNEDFVLHVYSLALN